MHHDVAAPVARLLAGVGVGRPRRHPSGLTLVPLAGGGGVPPPRGDLQVVEMRPPRAGALRVANRGPGTVAVHTGDLFAGGLADRAASEAAMFAPHAERVPAVEAVEGRWWWTGPPVRAGALEPPLSALVALAGLAGLDGDARGGLAAIARTCLWALGPHSGLGEPSRPELPDPVTPAWGWVLLGDATVLAARIWGGPRPLALPPDATAAPHRGAEDAARRFLAVLATARWMATETGNVRGEVAGHHARAVLHAGRVVELGSVRLSEELAGLLLRAAVGAPAQTPMSPRSPDERNQHPGSTRSGRRGSVPAGSGIGRRAGPPR